MKYLQLESDIHEFACSLLTLVLHPPLTKMYHLTLVHYGILSEEVRVTYKKRCGSLINIFLVSVITLCAFIEWITFSNFQEGIYPWFLLNYTDFSHATSLIKPNFHTFEKRWGHEAVDKNRMLLKVGILFHNSKIFKMELAKIHFVRAHVIMTS